MIMVQDATNTMIHDATAKDVRLMQLKSDSTLPRNVMHLLSKQDLS